MTFRVCFIHEPSGHANTAHWPMRMSLDFKSLSTRRVLPSSVALFNFCCSWSSISYLSQIASKKTDDEFVGIDRHSLIGVNRFAHAD